MIENRRVAAPLPPRLVGAEPNLLAFPSRDRLVTFTAQRRLDGNFAVEAPRKVGRLAARVGQQIHLPCTVRGGDDDLVGEADERQLELRCVLHCRLAVVGVKDHGVALEKLVGPAGSVEQRLDRCVGALERDVVGSQRSVHVRCVVEVGEVVDEEVEAVTRHEPAADGGGVCID